jgi:thiol-disulfide isomerase/thioredoxin
VSISLGRKIHCQQRDTPVPHSQLLGEVMKHFAPAAMVLSVLLAMAGCQEASTTTDSNTTNPPIDYAANPSVNVEIVDGVEEATSVEVSVGDRAALDALLAKHKGKVILVDFWATWCPPCVKEFPHTVEVGRTSDPSKLAVITVSMDEPDDEEKVLQFLYEREATFDNMISKYGVGQEGFEAFELGDGGVPHYKIYDRAGELRHTANSNKDLDQVIQKLLNEE